MQGEGTFGARLARTLRKELALFWPTLVLVVPYLVSNQLAFGRMMPISGALKTSFPVAGWTPRHMNVEHLGLLAARRCWARASSSRAAAAATRWCG